MVPKKIKYQLDVCSCLATYLLNTDYTTDKFDKCLGIVLTLDYNQVKLFFKLIMSSSNEQLKLGLYDSKLVSNWIKKYEDKLYYDIINDKMENWEEE